MGLDNIGYLPGVHLAVWAAKTGGEQYLQLERVPERESVRVLGLVVYLRVQVQALIPVLALDRERERERARVCRLELAEEAG